MTVKDLMQLLGQFHPDAQVVIEDRYGDYYEFKIISDSEGVRFLELQEKEEAFHSEDWYRHEA